MAQAELKGQQVQGQCYLLLGIASSMAAVQIVLEDQTGRLILDSILLKEIFTRADVKNAPVAILSVAGDFRKGKSFLLNFFLRYFRHDRRDNWLRVDTDEKLEGFPWTNGAARETTGIWMWSEPLMMADKDGGQVALFLMDTQGAFDSRLTLQNTTRIFAMTSMVSSVMIFNLQKDLQSNHLQDLNIFTEYGKIAMENETETPFEKLVFLIRDWQHVCDYKWGREGGNDYLNKFLATRGAQCAESRRVGETLRANFKQLDCFLMPHPGDAVRKNPEFRGEIRHLEEDFLAQMHAFVADMTRDSQIEAKSICFGNGTKRALTGERMSTYLSEYFACLTSAETPPMEDLYDLTVDMHNRAAVELALEEFDAFIREFNANTMLPIAADDFQKAIDLARVKAVDAFFGARKMGGNGDSEKYLNRLMEDVLPARIVEVMREKEAAERIFELVDEVLAEFIRRMTSRDEGDRPGVLAAVDRFGKRFVASVTKLFKRK